jgi:glycosyltransferase involved in cell wall biosynthesis
MRVVIVSDQYRPIIGGLETHVELLAQELTRRGHEITVVTLGMPGLPSFEAHDGVRIHRIGGWTSALGPSFKDPKRRFHPTVPDPGFVRGLARIVRLERPQIIHAHGWALYSALALKRRAGTKLAATLHDFSLVCAKKIYVHEGTVCSGPAYGKCLRCSRESYGLPKAVALTTGLRLSSRMHDRIDRCIAVSSAVARSAEAQLPRERITIIPSFVAADAAVSANNGKRPAFLPPDDGYLLFVGALGAHKGLDVLLQAYELLQTAVPLVVIGTPRHDAPRSYPEGVIVATDVAHPQVMAAWQRSSVGVVPSTCPEGFGIVAVEAMAAGRPVVASAIGGLPDIVCHGVTGLLVQPGDPGGLRDALARLMQDPQLRAAMGASARERAQAFTAPYVVTKIESLYHELVAGAAAPATTEA